MFCPDVTLRTEKDSYTKDVKSIKLIFDNQSTFDLGYNATAYQAQIEKDSKWFNIPFKNGTVFNEVAIMCPAGKTATLLCDTSEWNVTLSKGTYRIVCEVSNISQTQSGNSKELLAAEFAIE